jgi:hypothetical protein
MRCARARRMIHLNREGELPERLRTRILRHAEWCAECTAELELIRRTEAAYASLRNPDPVLRDPAALTQEVMRRVEAGVFAPKGRWFEKISTEWIPLDLRSGLRLAAALLVFIFFTQSTLDGDRMARLDERLSQVPATRAELVPSLSRIAGAPTLASALAGADPDEIGLPGLLKFFGNGTAGTSSLMDRLRTKYRGLFSVSAEDGLDERERAILATEGRAFLKELEQYVEIAEGNHAH